MQGLPRILAALHAHMWPGLVRKEREFMNPPALQPHESSAAPAEARAEAEENGHVGGNDKGAAANGDHTKAEEPWEVTDPFGVDRVAGDAGVRSSP